MCNRFGVNWPDASYAWSDGHAANCANIRVNGTAKLWSCVICPINVRYPGIHCDTESALNVGCTDFEHQGGFCRLNMVFIWRQLAILVGVIAFVLGAVAAEVRSHGRVWPYECLNSSHEHDSLCAGECFGIGIGPQGTTRDQVCSDCSV